MDVEFRKLVEDVVAEHPGPWVPFDGYGDAGGRFTSIRDAKCNDVFDGEFGALSNSVFNLLLNFPELAAQLLADVQAR